MKKETDKIILIADYGRSGQGWLSYMLCYILNARYLEPYCLLRGIVHSGKQSILDLTQGNLGGREPSNYSLVVKTHHYPDPYFSLTDKVILLARDPRDVVVSAYARFNVMEKTGTDVESAAQKMVVVDKIYKPKQKWRHKLITWLFSNRLFFFPLTARGWRKFYEVWENINICYKVTYEALSANPKNTLKGILKYLETEAPSELIDEAIEKFAFEQITKRKKGEEVKNDVAFRKGIVGDYKNHLSKLDLMIFRVICGKIANKWGYSL